MPPTSPPSASPSSDSSPEAEQVHHLDVEAGRGSRLPSLIGLGLLVIVAAGGAWFMLTDPLGGQATAEAPPPAADNLLGAAWSFESTDESDPLSAWIVPDEAPAGFSFSESAAFSGAAGASALTNESGWSRILSTAVQRVDPGKLVELAAHSDSPNIQLLLHFTGEGLPPFDVVVASGQGEIVGRASAPPGYDAVCAGLGCVGAGSADDLVLRLVTGGEANQQTVEQGVFELVVQAGAGLVIARDLDPLMIVWGSTIRLADGSSLPVTAARLPGEDALALPDGQRATSSFTIEPSGGHQLLRTTLGGAPAGATLVTQGVLLGALAAAPLGVRTGGSYDRFTNDFVAHDVDSLVLGRTQDRLVLDMTETFSISATYQGDESITFTVERSLTASSGQELMIQAGFREERVKAAGLLADARAMESEGDLGGALVQLDEIVKDFPFDEQVLADATADRARLAVAADERLNVLAGDLDDAVFLGNPERCAQLLSDARHEVETWAGSPAATAFEAFESEAVERAGRIVSVGEGRATDAVRARLESFREDGRFPSVVEVMQEALATLESESGS